MRPKDFVTKYMAEAKYSEEKTGISAIFTLAQAAIESEWGDHAPRYNFFGVKATHQTPQNKRQLLTTTEYLWSPDKDNLFPVVLSKVKTSSGRWKCLVKDWFRAYDTAREGFDDHANLFLSSRRYAKAVMYSDNPIRFAEEVAKAGYATAPN